MQEIDGGAVGRRIRKVIAQANSADRLIDKIHARGGTVAAFGGLVRDMALMTPGSFSSDLDLVVDDISPGALADIIHQVGWQSIDQNRYGGWRLSAADAMLDLWTLDSTWAFRTGVIRGADFVDLLRTTFFDRDAAVYEITTGRLHLHPRMEQACLSRAAEINLPRNPNPLGALVRALRLSAGRLRLGPHLVLWCVNALETYSPLEIRRAERRGYSIPRLSVNRVQALTLLMKRHISQCPLLPFEPPEPVQLPLIPHRTKPIAH